MASEPFRPDRSSENRPTRKINGQWSGSFFRIMSPFIPTTHLQIKSDRMPIGRMMTQARFGYLLLDIIEPQSSKPIYSLETSPDGGALLLSALVSQMRLYHFGIVSVWFNTNCGVILQCNTGCWASPQITSCSVSRAAIRINEKQCTATQLSDTDE